MCCVHFKVSARARDQYIMPMLTYFCVLDITHHI